jgi:hypothetical protein
MLAASQTHTALWHSPHSKKRAHACTTFLFDGDIQNKVSSVFAFAVFANVQTQLAVSWIHCSDAVELGSLMTYGPHMRAALIGGGVGHCGWRGEDLWGSQDDETAHHSHDGPVGLYQTVCAIISDTHSSLVLCSSHIYNQVCMHCNSLPKLGWHQLNHHQQHHTMGMGKWIFNYDWGDEHLHGWVFLQGVC